jgi:hypothetical protein
MKPIKTGPQLDRFLLDDLIEECNRGNPLTFSNNVEESLFLVRLESWLEELKALRQTNRVLETQMVWKNREINNLKFEMECLSRLQEMIGEESKGFGFDKNT